MYAGVHLNVSWESYSLELFDLPLDVATLGIGNKPGIHGLCIPVDSFDLSCESVTLNCNITVLILYPFMLCIF